MSAKDCPAPVTEPAKIFTKQFYTFSLFLEPLSNSMCPLVQKKCSIMLFKLHELTLTYALRINMNKQWYINKITFFTFPGFPKMKVVIVV